MSGSLDQKSRSSQSLDKYLQEIGETQLLTAEEEIDLTQRIKAGDKEALGRMVKANLRFVVSIAKTYQNKGLSLGDLINEGNLGLIKAAKRFDESRGFKFISYAVWWIRQGILQALANHSRVVRLPLNRVGIVNKVGRISGGLEQELERLPSTAEIATELGIEETEVADAFRLAGYHLSLDMPFDNNADSNLLFVLQEEDEPAPDGQLNTESLKIEILVALRTLDKREAEVLKMYFGIDRDEPMTLEEIGDKFNLTRERIRQIKEGALRRMRHISRSRSLRKFFS